MNANCIWKCEKMIRKESVVRETHLHLIKPNLYFFENQEKLWKLLVFRVLIALAYLFFQAVFSLSTTKIDILTINLPKSPTTWPCIFYYMAQLSSPHWSVWLWDSSDISERIQERNFCSMDCSFDKWNYYQLALYLHNLALLLFTQLMFLSFFTFNFPLMWLWYLTGAEK